MPQPRTSETEPSGPSLARNERIWQVVAAIPTGSVATYGQVAELAGLPRRARMVGRVLRDLPSGSRLPWHRVLRADGTVAERPGGSGRTQLERLRAEGVLAKGRRVDLARYRWQPD